MLQRIDCSSSGRPGSDTTCVRRSIARAGVDLRPPAWRRGRVEHLVVRRPRLRQPLVRAGDREPDRHRLAGGHRAPHSAARHRCPAPYAVSSHRSGCGSGVPEAGQMTAGSCGPRKSGPELAAHRREASCPTTAAQSWAPSGCAAPGLLAEHQRVAVDAARVRRVDRQLARRRLAPGVGRPSARSARPRSAGPPRGVAAAKRQPDQLRTGPVRHDVRAGHHEHHGRAA